MTGLDLLIPSLPGQGTVMGENRLKSMARHPNAAATFLYAGRRAAPTDLLFLVPNSFTPSLGPG
jgi:hypothetical protein